MNNNTVWLEIDKTNQAVLSYFLEQPTAPSDKVEYVQATCDELLYLSVLEDVIFSPGMVATLGDLETHRARVIAAKKAGAITAKPASNAPQQHQKPNSSNSNNNPQTINKNVKASLIAAVRKHRSRK